MEVETREEIERKILLKKQLILLTEQEIVALREKAFAIWKKEKASESAGT